MPNCGRAAFGLVSAMALTACQTGKPSDALSVRSSENPTKLIVAVATQAQKCWFKSGDRNFSGYKLANEVNSHAGRPRILLVPRSNPSGLPVLVVQAEQKGSGATGTYTNLQSFGPLLATGNGARINQDISRWAKGTATC